MRSTKMLTRRRLLAVLLAGGMVGCSLLAPKFEKPTVTVVGVELLGGNFLQQSLRVKFAVENPNDRALPVKALRAELKVAGERVASGTSARAFVVPTHGTGNFDMTISTNLALALLTLNKKRTDASADAIDYELTGAATVDLPFVGELPFRQNGSLALKGLH